MGRRSLSQDHSENLQRLARQIKANYSAADMGVELLVKRKSRNARCIWGRRTCTIRKRNARFRVGILPTWSCHRIRH
jgi:hypothetical protein